MYVSVYLSLPSNRVKLQKQQLLKLRFPQHLLFRLLVALKPATSETSQKTSILKAGLQRPAVREKKTSLKNAGLRTISKPLAPKGGIQQGPK